MISLAYNVLLYVVPFLVVLGVVVMVHELGHFLAGKWLGASIDRFAIGFGRPIASWTDRAGVEWRIGWIPLGGYVKFSGDDNVASVPDDDGLRALKADLVAQEGEGALSRYFHFKPLWQRAIIVAAGPLANFLLAIAIFAALLATLGEPLTPARVDALKPGGAAERAGVQVGDVIIKADGEKIDSFSDLKALVILRSGTPMNLLVDRSGRQVLIVATPIRGPVPDQLGNVQQLGTLGIESRRRPGDFTIRRYTIPEAVVGGVDRTVDVIKTTVRYVGRIFAGRETAEHLSGPLGMAQLSGAVTKQAEAVSPTIGLFLLNAFITMLELAASISVGIGFLNLLPIPVLDGGHLLFYAYEAVARRPLAAKVQAAGYRVGLALVLGLMLFATWNDLQRLRVFKLFGGLFS